MKAEILSSNEQLDEIVPHWNRLLERTARTSIFLTPEWMRTWWEVFGGESRPFLVGVRDSGRLVGLLPAYISGRRRVREDPVPRQLRILGTVSVCSDRLDGIVEQGYEEPVVDAWRVALREHRQHWASIEFADLSPDGHLGRALLKEPRAWGVGLDWTVTEGISCPTILLPDSWQEYLSSRSARARREIRHDRRVLQNIGDYAARAQTSEVGLDDAMTSFIRLHQMRWESLGEVGSFADSRFERFHRAVALRFANRGWLKLWFLEAKGAPIAARYQFRYRDRIYDYLPGHDPEWHKYSVGLVLLSHCVENAVEDGCCEVDLLRGLEAYKSRWASEVRNQVTVTGARRFSRVWAHHRARKIVRRILRRDKGAVTRHEANGECAPVASCLLASVAFLRQRPCASLGS